MNIWKLFKSKQKETSSDKKEQKTLNELLAETHSKTKEEATKEGKPWVAVLETHVNPSNIRHGFFELDWNNEFIEHLIDAGFKGESQEELVDKWFRTIVMQMLQDEGQSTDREMGHINVVPIDKNRSEIS